MENKNYCNELESFLTKEFVPAGYKITKNVELESVPESSEYEALVFSLNEKNIVYRKGKVTPDRPGAFLAVWQRPSSPSINGNKPIPLKSNEFDYLFVRVENYFNDRGNEKLINDSKSGIFIFPVSLLIEKGIVSSTKSKGKTGFRVFPPWSQDRGIIGTKVFSESGKKTQRWQLPYFLEIDGDGSIDSYELKKVVDHENV
ncbi:MAG: MepB family protein [Xanthomonadales bacterium]|nr:MepB family protein [Xanthomonadales bacterium]